MKLNGRKISGPNVILIVIPRPNAESGDLVFKAQAVLDYSKFSAFCPHPKVPLETKPGGVSKENPEHPAYKEQMVKYSQYRYAWIMIESLKATENLEWETIQSDKPETWLNFEKELQDSGLSGIEIGRIANGVLEANCLNEDKITEARNRFLASAPAPSSTQ